MREHGEELFAAAHAFLYFLLGVTPLGDVQERHDRSDDVAVSEDRMTPVFG